MKKRIFIGIFAPPEIQQAVADWQARSSLNVIWLAPDSLHITLIPPFYADETELAEVKEKCRSVLTGTGPFTVQFDAVSFGPDKREPRLVWASGETPAELSNLKERLDEKFPAGENKRKFIPHLTIARFKPEAFREFKVKELNEKVDWRGTVSNFALISSKLTPAGASYEVIEDYKL